MGTRVLIIDGHPDVKPQRFVHALVAAYRDAAIHAGHDVRIVEIARFEVPPLSGNHEFAHGTPSDAIRRVQRDVEWCEHLVLVYPLWLGSMPGQLKMLFEQVMRPGFAFDSGSHDGLPRKLLKGKSARIVVTMGMPGFFYRWYYRGHSLKSLKRNILRFVGFAPVHAIVIGNVETPKAGVRERWLARMAQLGAAAN